MTHWNWDTTETTREEILTFRPDNVPSLTQFLFE